MRVNKRVSYSFEINVQKEYASIKSHSYCKDWEIHRILDLPLYENNSQKSKHTNKWLGSNLGGLSSQKWFLIRRENHGSQSFSPRGK